MNIFFVTPSVGFGGAERVMSVLANEMVKQNNIITFIVFGDSSKPAYSLSSSINVVLLPGFRILKPFVNLVMLYKLRRIIKKTKPDVILSFFNNTAVFTLIAKLFLDIPLIYSERNDPNNNLKGVVARLFQFITVRFCNYLVFQTKAAQSCYTKQFHSKSSVILNPFDTNKLPEYYSGERENVIVTVGRLAPQKNQSMLISAFKLLSSHHPEYKLIIYGEGPLRNDLLKQIKEDNLESRILLLGNSTNVVDQINNCSVFAFTSLYEGLPNALIEAMALGLPCVSTNCSPGGVKELIDHMHNGILVDDFYATTFSKALTFMIDNPSKAKQMGLKAREITQKMRVEVIVSEWIDVISKLIYS